MHMMSLFLLAADAVTSGSWFIVFHVLVLKIAMLTVILPLSKFGLGSEVVFFQTLGPELHSQ